MIVEFLQSGLLPTVLLLVRAVVPLLALYVVWRCYTSFKKGQRRRDPVIMLWDEASGTRFPVLYWENSIGRSKSCDIYLPDPSASRDHAVLVGLSVTRGPSPGSRSMGGRLREGNW